METKRWGTVRDAAEHFGISRQRVHQLLKKGALGECKSVNTPRGIVWLIEKPFRRRHLVNGVHTGEKETEVGLSKRRTR
jgi:hypothetical protein